MTSIEYYIKQKKHYEKHTQNQNLKERKLGSIAHLILAIVKEKSEKNLTPKETDAVRWAKEYILGPDIHDSESSKATS